jgi:hypothetical protein
MAAIDTFDWFIRTIDHPATELKQYLSDQRSYLFSLRSEDERQRFVEQTMRDLKAMLTQRPPGQRL